MTWNLAERFPDMEHLGFLRDLRGHDLIVVGVQEFQPVVATVGLSASAHHHTIWEAMLASTLGPRYGMPGSCTMGAVHVAVFARRELLPTFSNLQTSSIACGVGNVLTNKGAVAIKFNICDVSVCFTCAHLCCGTEKVLERNGDFQRVDAELPQVISRQPLALPEKPATTNKRMLNVMHILMCLDPCLLTCRLCSILIDSL